MNSTIVNKSMNDIINHIQFSISIVPKILQLTDFFNFNKLKIEKFNYNPSLDNISLSWKFTINLTLEDKDTIKKICALYDTQIVLMIENQLILKYKIPKK